MIDNYAAIVFLLEPILGRKTRNCDLVPVVMVTQSCNVQRWCVVLMHHHVAFIKEGDCAVM